MIVSRLISAFSAAKLAFAQADVEGIISTVGGSLGERGDAGGGFGGIATALASTVVPLFYFVAVILIIRAGVLLAISQEEDQLAKSRRTIVAVLSSIVLLNVAGSMQQALYSAPGANILTNPSGSSSILSTELLGLISFLEVPAAVIAVLVIIIAGIRAVTSYGGEGGTQKLRQAVIAVLAGMVLLSAKYFIAADVTQRFNPSGIIGTMISVINIVLSFTALVATAIVVYAGFLMVVNVGNDEQYTRARSLIIRVGIGLIVILMSMAIITVVSGQWIGF